VDQHGRDCRQLYRTDQEVAWLAREPQSGDRYLALFNLADRSREVAADLATIGVGTPASVRDLWAKAPLGITGRHLAVTLPAHGAGLYRIG
jgi:hypothetical protein